MGNFSLKHIEDITGGTLRGDCSIKIKHILTDSRTPSTGGGAMFVAIKGQRFDGHNFIPDLISKGVRVFLVEESFFTTDEASFVLVKDPLTAFQQIVAHHRRQFDIPVVAITGSNGKTTTKEWLFQMLSANYNVVKNPKSYNSQVGVPLSVWQLNKHHNLAVFEAGISQPGEMEKLEKILKPTLGIFTNLGSAHDSGFTSRDQKLQEKLRLFSNAETVICNNVYHQVLEGQLPNSTIKSWQWLSKNSLEFNGTEYPIVQRFQNKAYNENLGNCAALMLHLSISADEINEWSRWLQPVAMRLNVKEGRRGTILVNDSYNNDIQALSIALQHSRQQGKDKDLVLILSDFLQSGKSDADLLSELNVLLDQYQVSRILAVGKWMKEHEKQLNTGTKSVTAFESVDSLLISDEIALLSNSIITIKGARKFKFERIVDALARKLHGTQWEINLSALINNLNVYKSLLEPKTKVLVMVKALAYGAGADEIAKVLEHQHINYLGVAFPEEGEALRNAGLQSNILVMNAADGLYEKVIDNKLEVQLYAIDQLHSFVQFLNRKNITHYPVHIKLDTGMHRLGFGEESIDALIEFLKDNDTVHVKGILSHLAASDDLGEKAFTLGQINKFEKLSKKIEDALRINPIKHLLNSAGIVNYPQAQYDMVRLGLGIYGIDSSEKLTDRLRQIGTLKTHITQIRKVAKGESVGYSRAFKTYNDVIIAVIPIGYADGFDRRFSKGVGEVLIGNARCKVVGNICMDMAMIDVSDLKDVKVGDEVILTSPALPVTELSDKVDIIPYEFLTNVSPRINRIVYYE